MIQSIELVGIIVYEVLDAYVWSEGRVAFSNI